MWRGGGRQDSRSGKEATCVRLYERTPAPRSPFVHSYCFRISSPSMLCQPPCPLHVDNSHVCACRLLSSMDG